MRYISRGMLGISQFILVPKLGGKNMDCAIVCHKSTGTDHLLGFHGQFMCSDCLKVPGGIPVTATQVCMDITGLDMETLKFLRR